MDSVELDSGDELTVFGNIAGEPWLAVQVLKTASLLWIEEANVVLQTNCMNLNNIFPLEMIFQNEDKPISEFIYDSFNGFDYDWIDNSDNSVQRELNNESAQLVLDDRVPENVESVSEAKLNEHPVTIPFELITNVHPENFYRTSYWGFASARELKAKIHGWSYV
jgi:hypothetical protein